MRIAALSLFAAGAALASQPTHTIEELRLDRSSIDRIEEALPTVTVDRDDFEIDRSCIVRVGAGVIEDANGNGVIHIVADNVIVIFDKGSQLAGHEPIEQWRRIGLLDQLSDEKKPAAWNTLTGTGISINGRSGVEIIGANIRGYRNGIVAVDAPGLAITDANLTDLYRQRLRSTATREDTSDWLYPHENDDNEWLTKYGAAIWAERCHNAKFDGVRVRRGQNGIILDNTNGAVIINNDCSFLSGWGLAMWRSSGNLIRDNRFDFCVRGHVEGVYNRGQDSAGILMFEACSNNRVEHNSCTHSGDGVFGFGGNDAVEEAIAGPWGNANNLFRRNDLSFSPAHGLEMTFSEGNVIEYNTFDSNAICGIWGGYSQQMKIRHNHFMRNGGMAYGAERGGINIEHGAMNSISYNSFINNRCGVRFWWDHDESLLGQPGVKSRYKGVVGNQIENCLFVMDDEHPFLLDSVASDRPIMVGVEAQVIGDRSDFDGPTFEKLAIADVLYGASAEGAVETRVDTEVTPYNHTAGRFHSGMIGYGASRKPIADRRAPAGREWIICDQWGPWDFESPLMRAHSQSGSQHIYEIYPPVGSDMIPIASATAANTELVPPESDAGHEPWRLIITPKGDAPVTTYNMIVQLGTGDEVSWSDARWNHNFSGRFLSTTWNARCWAWENDPLVDLEAWRAEAEDVQVTAIDRLDLPFGNSGPSRVNHALTVSERDRFAVIAETEIALPEGTWKLSTLSDDGIRVFVNGEVVLERWDIHGPTPDEAVFEVTDDTPTRIKLEYFENDGYATLGLDLQAVE